MIKPRVRQLAQGVGFYPLSMFWVVAAVLLILVAEEYVSLVQGLILLTLAALLALMLSVQNEVKVVHTLVNEQRNELLARIDLLVALLIQEGIVVPPTSEREQLARDQSLGVRQR